MRTLRKTQTTESDPTASGIAASWYAAVVDQIPWAKDAFTRIPTDPHVLLHAVRYGPAPGPELRRRLVTRLEAIHDIDGSLLVGKFDFQTTRSRFDLLSGPSRKALKGQLSVILELTEQSNSRTTICEIVDREVPARSMRYLVTAPRKEVLSGAEPLVLRVEVGGQILEGDVVLRAPAMPLVVQKLRKLIGSHPRAMQPEGVFLPVLAPEVWERNLVFQSRSGGQAGGSGIVATPSFIRCILATVVATWAFGPVVGIIVRVACWSRKAY